MVLYQLGDAFEILFKNKELEEAVKEKWKGADIWKEVNEMCNSIGFNRTPDGDYLKITTEYAYRLFEVVKYAWSLMAYGFVFDKTCKVNRVEFSDTLNKYSSELSYYKELEKDEISPSFYRLDYLYNQPGMDDTIEKYIAKILK